RKAEGEKMKSIKRKYETKYLDDPFEVPKMNLYLYYTVTARLTLLLCYCDVNL
ncbi:hypothetical protein AVEN_267949-2-1, partial [Araneus ventricosus]